MAPRVTFQKRGQARDILFACPETDLTAIHRINYDRLLTHLPADDKELHNFGPRLTWDRHLCDIRREMKRVFPFLLALCLAHGGGVASAATQDSVLRAKEGAANLLRGKYEEAIASFDSALSAEDLADVNRANILNDRGVAKWRLKQTKEAIADFNKSVELFPDYAIVYNNRGNALLDLGEAEQAVLDFSRAIDLAPGYGAAFNNRGNALLALGRKEEALKDFRKAVRLMPTNAVPYNGRGQTHAALGRPFAGVRDFSRALALNAKYTGARKNRGHAFLKLNQENEAVGDFTELIAQKADTPEFYVARGQAYARTRRYNAAVRDLNKAISLDGSLAEAYKLRGRVYLDVKKVDEARDDLSVALSLEPENVDALTARAKTFFLQGLAEEALADVDKALSLDSENSEALALRGQIYESVGRTEEAVSDYTAALSSDANIAVARAALQKLGIAPPPQREREYIGEEVKGWRISRDADGQYLATNRRYPKMKVRLEMYGEGVPEILDWTLMKYSLQGIGLLRYRAGTLPDRPDKSYEYSAVIDLWKAKVVSVEPHSWGVAQARWEWKMASVSVTDPDGVTNEITLRTAPAETYGQGDDYWQNDSWWSEGSQPAPRRPAPRRPSSGGGLFDWLFR